MGAQPCLLDNCRLLKVLVGHQVALSVVDTSAIWCPGYQTAGVRKLPFSYDKRHVALYHLLHLHLFFFRCSGVLGCARCSGCSWCPLPLRICPGVLSPLCICIGVLSLLLIISGVLLPLRIFPGVLLSLPLGSCPTSAPVGPRGQSALGRLWRWPLDLAEPLYFLLASGTPCASAGLGCRYPPRVFTYYLWHFPSWSVLIWSTLASGRHGTLVRHARSPQRWPPKGPRSHFF